VSDAGAGGVALELDCRTLLCPRPVIELARHVGDVPVGAVVAVVATDAAARHDVPAWCRMRGHTFVGEDRAEDGVPRYLVRRDA
jgi:TusA-related sulfurtransferase